MNRSGHVGFELAVAAVILSGCGGSAPHPNSGPQTGSNVSENPDSLRARLAHQEDLTLTTATESASRAAAVLPTQPSEDASAVLGRLEIPAPAAVAGPDREYLPDESVDWVVTVQFADDPRLEPRRVASLFNASWREEFGSVVIYGLDPDSGRWTYLVSPDGPAAVTRLKFSWDYVDPLEERPPRGEAFLFQRRLDELGRKLIPLGTATLAASVSPEQAADRTNQLAQLKSELDFTAVLILKAPPQKPFEGRDIWDVMLCLGLKWGDMDCFHWVNDGEVGGDSHFSVQTSTSPGYFLPEQIAAGELQVDDLVFVYSVPRSAKPLEVFDALNRAVEYCRKRLGGEIRHEHGGAADLSMLRCRIADIERRLQDAHLPPGSNPALRLF